MKKVLYMMMAAALVLAGCQKAEKTNREGIGRLSVKLSSGGSYVTKAGENLDVNEFNIKITRSDGWTQEYPRYADMPQVLELGSGSYTVSAVSPVVKDAAFDLPIYGGSASFSIRAGELTPVQLGCTLTNMKVSFELSDNFRNELSDYRIVVTNAASWTADDVETRTLEWANKAEVDAGTPGYFTVAPLLIKVYGVRAIDSNAQAVSDMAITRVAARDHHVIKLDAQVTGSMNGFQLVIDSSVNEKTDDVYVPGWDEVPVDGGDNGGDNDDPGTTPDPQDPPVVSTAPTMSWASNPDFADTPIQSTMDVEIVIEAPEKIATFIVSVDSGVLSETIAALATPSDYAYAPGNPFNMDLIGDQTLIENLDGMGLNPPLPTGNALLGQTRVVFPLSSLIPMIDLYSPEPGSKHIFTLKVSDEKGQVLQKALTFYKPE